MGSDIFFGEDKKPGSGLSSGGIGHFYSQWSWEEPALGQDKN